MPPIEEQLNTAPPEPHKSWIVAHPIGITISVVVLLLTAGTLIVVRHSSAPTQAGTSAWGGGIQSLINPSGYMPDTTQDDILRQIQNTGSGSYTMPDLTPTKTPTPTVNPSTANDYESILKELSGSGKTVPVASNTGGAADFYSFIPTGLVSAATAQERTEDQQRLFEYGNEVGSSIQSFEDQHRNMVQVLKDQIEDQGNTAKANAVIALGRDLKEVGIQMQGMEFVPSEAAGMHANLAKSYISIGEKLQIVPKAKGPQELLAAIEMYNNAANEFVQHYANLALLFSVSDVKFKADDPGSVFVFSASGAVQ